MKIAMPSHVEIVEALCLMLKPVSEVRNADAAVALLLKLVNREFKVLLVERTESSLDPWSGQMAFPGGKRDSKDADIVDTVFRETFEETGIDLGQDCRLLGVLENVRSTVRPKLLVAPFVFLLEHEPTVVLNEELERFLWIALTRLRERVGTAKFPFGEVSAYLVERSVIWGLTYRILEKFTRILEQAIRGI